MNATSLGTIAKESVGWSIGLLVGVYTLVHPLAGLASLTLVLAIYLFAEGGFGIRPVFPPTPSDWFELAAVRWNCHFDPRDPDLEDLAIEYRMGDRHACVSVIPITQGKGISKLRLQVSINAGGKSLIEARRARVAPGEKLGAHPFSL